MNKHKARFNRWVDKVADEWQKLDKKHKRLFAIQIVALLIGGLIAYSFVYLATVSLKAPVPDVVDIKKLYSSVQTLLALDMMAFGGVFFIGWATFVGMFSKGKK